MATFNDMRHTSWDALTIPAIRTSGHATTHHIAMMHNFSEDGLYFESRDPVGPGTHAIETTAGTSAVTRVPKNRP